MVPITNIMKTINVTKARSFVTVPPSNKKVNSQIPKPLPQTRARITMFDKRYSESISKVAKLKGIEQQEYQKGLLGYNKIKSEVESKIKSLKSNQETKSSKSKLKKKSGHQKNKPELSELDKIKAEFEKQAIDVKGLTPSEAANKILELSLSKTRPYLGYSLNFIEYPIKNYARSRLEQIFTVLAAEDGRVDENVVNNVSSYALHMFLLLVLVYLWEKQRNHKESIKKLEGELEDLEERYSEDVHTHNHIREKIIKLSEDLLKYKQEASKYEDILAKLKEAQEALTIESEKQTTLEFVTQSFSFMMVSTDERQRIQVSSYLHNQLDVASKQTIRELEKTGRVNSLVIKSEDKIEELNKKIDKTEKELEKLMTSASLYAEHLKYTGTKHDERVVKLKNTWGYSFFSQYKDKSEESHLKSVQQNSPF